MFESDIDSGEIRERRRALRGKRRECPAKVAVEKVIADIPVRDGIYGAERRRLSASWSADMRLMRKGLNRGNR